jgi:hypothetical protein
MADAREDGVHRGDIGEALAIGAQGQVFSVRELAVVAVRVLAVKRLMTSAGRTGTTGRRMTPWIREMSAELTPMASARVRRATTVKPGDLRRERSAKRMAASLSWKFKFKEERAWISELS